MVSVLWYIAVLSSILMPRNESARWWGWQPLGVPPVWVLFCYHHKHSRVVGRLEREMWRGGGGGWSTGLVSMAPVQNSTRRHVEYSFHLRGHCSSCRIWLQITTTGIVLPVQHARKGVLSAAEMVSRLKRSAFTALILLADRFATREFVILTHVSM
jgi:hypothetical protein